MAPLLMSPNRDNQLELVSTQLHVFASDRNRRRTQFFLQPCALIPLSIFNRTCPATLTIIHTRPTTGPEYAPPSSNTVHNPNPAESLQILAMYRLQSFQLITSDNAYWTIHTIQYTYICQTRYTVVLQNQSGAPSETHSPTYTSILLALIWVSNLVLRVD